MPKVAFLKVNNVSKEGVRKTVHNAMEKGNWKKYVSGKKIFVNGSLFR
jgi:hypothetical protein